MKREDLIKKWENEIKECNEVSHAYEGKQIALISNITKETISAMLNDIKELEPIHEAEIKALAIESVSKRTFFFDYLGAAYKNEFGHYVADSRTQEIEAYDEEHATLLFKEMHPGKQFDPPY